MQERDAETFTFGPYSLCARERVLRHLGRPVALAPKTLDVLFELAAEIGTVVAKDALLERVWPDAYIDESNLAQNVYVLRQMFKRDRSGVSIENIPKRGYRLLAPAPVAAISSPRDVRPAPRRNRPAAAAAAVAAVFAVLAITFPLHRWSTKPPGTMDQNSLESYMLGRSYLTAASLNDLHRAAKLFERAIRTSPEAPQAYAALAETDASLAYYARDAAERAALQARAMTFAHQAVALDASSADAYAALGGVEFSIDHRERPAESHFQRALAIDPNQPEALVWYGTLLLNRGAVERARAMFGHALGIERGSAGTAASLAWSDYVARDFPEAILLSKQMIYGHQLPWVARVTLANAYVGLGDYRRAREVAADLARNTGTQYQGAALTAQLDALQGRALTASRLLQRIDATTDVRAAGPWDAASIAAAYLALHDRTHAFAWLRRVDYFERRLIARDPRFASLVRDPHFASWVNG